MMLRFFRTLRRKFIEEDNMRKYIWYALGEILLVMIGILLALQVNNWNETRKDRDQETYYLEKLVDEMEGIRIETDYMLDFAALQQKHAQMVLDAIHSNSIPDTLSSGELLIAIQHSGWAPHPNFVSTVWDELNSTANLSLIQDKRISDSAGAIYANIDRIMSREDEFKDYNLEYRDAAYQTISPDIRFDIIELLKPEEVLRPYVDAPEAEPVLKELRKRQEVTRILTDIVITRRITTLFMEELKADVNDMLSLLK